MFKGILISLCKSKNKKFPSGNKHIFFCDQGYLPIILVNARDKAGTHKEKLGQAGTSRDNAGTSRDKAGTSRASPGTFPFVPACPCLSLFVTVCPCLPLSIPELLKSTIMQSHNCANFGLINKKQEILEPISCICHNLTKFFQFYMFFLIQFLTHISEQNCQSEHFDCAKEFAFRKSALSLAFHISPCPSLSVPVCTSLSMCNHVSIVCIYRTSLCMKTQLGHNPQYGSLP